MMLILHRDMPKPRHNSYKWSRNSDSNETMFSRGDQISEFDYAAYHFVPYPEQVCLFLTKTRICGVNLYCLLIFLQILTTLVIDDSLYLIGSAISTL